MISIIVPVYNTEEYLDKCILSIMAQTYADFELLLIDDGSTDSSGSICDKYAAQDSRVRVFHKENGGVSSARNLGLDNVRGEWIAFVDSDDSVKESFLCNMLPLRNEDFIMTSSDVRGECFPDAVYTGKDMIKIALSGWHMLCPWGKMFMSSIVSDYNIRFDESVCRGEDTMFNLRYLSYASSLRTTSEAYYEYNASRVNSLSKQQGTFEESMYIAVCIYKIGKLLSEKYMDITLEELISKYAGITWALWWNLARSPFAYRVKCIKQLFKDSDTVALMANYLRCDESGRKYAIFYWLGRFRLYRIAASIIP